MRPRVALVVGALAVLLVVGAVVGGTVGGLAARNSQTEAGGSSSTVPVSTSATVSPTSTTSTSTSTSIPTPSNSVVPLNCPAINATQYNTESGSSFIIYCQMSLEGSTPIVLSVMQYSIDDCIDTCVEYSLNNTDAPCQGIGFGANLTE